MTALPVLLALLPQGAPPAGAPGPWRTIDRPVAIVNQDLITASRLAREMQRVARERPLTTDTEIRAAENQVLTNSVKERLRIQAGANLGVDERLIDARVTDSLERLRTRQGGVVGLVRFLDTREVSGPDLKRRLREDIYGQMWAAGQTGDAPGPLGRVIADRYVRPGALRFQYEAAVRNPADLAALGGKPGLLRIEQAVFDPERSGGLDAAREQARELARRVEGGAEWVTAARELGAIVDGEGALEVEEERLRELFPDIAAFTSGAAAGQVSGPIETTARDRRAVRVVRFLAREAAVVPDFADAEVQEALRLHAENRLEEYRLESGYAALLRQSYVWPPELFGRPK